MATALLKFKLRTGPYMGIFRQRCGSVVVIEAGKPCDSLPKTSTSPGWKAALQISRSAWREKYHFRG